MADGSDLPFDWRNPDYVSVIERRTTMLRRLRRMIREEVEADALAERPPRRVPTAVSNLWAYYRDGHMDDFLNDWGVTVDPRNVEVGLPTVMPFMLFPRQRDYTHFVIRKWRERRPGLVEKSRDMGVSWLAVGIGAGLCLAYDGMQVGYGSRKEDLVDLAGDPKSLFWKARAFLSGLPVEMRGGWEPKHQSAHMRLTFPATGSSMTGEAGDNIGRGDRTGMYFVDEAAHLAHPKLTDASLSQTTNCRIDQSSVNGSQNSFALKRFSGKVEVFIFDWREDPRKDPDHRPYRDENGKPQSWYEKQVAELDPVVLAQEVDRDYSASVEGIIIPGEWARAAIDAHKVLELAISGRRFGALDVADEGVDRNAYASGQGFLVDHLEEWSGKGSDIFGTTARAFSHHDEFQDDAIRYDADGIGAGVRGDARVLNERRKKPVKIEAYRGSGGIVDPLRKTPGTERTNEDFFKNFKAQSWWSLRQRFYRTWQMVTEFLEWKAGKITREEMTHQFDPSEIISLDSRMKLCQALVTELSQATFDWNGEGKMVVDKAPDDMKSPNLADAVVIRFAPMHGPLMVSRDAVNRALARGNRAGR